MHRYPDICKHCGIHGWRVFLPRWVGRTCPACSGHWLVVVDARLKILSIKRSTRTSQSVDALRAARRG